MKYSVAYIILLIGCFAGSVAHASFINSSAALDAYYPNLSPASLESIGTATVVDSGMEFPWVLTGYSDEFPEGTPAWQADITGNQIYVFEMSDFNNLGPADFSGFVFTFTGLPANIQTVSLNPASTLIPADFWATPNKVYLNYQGLGYINTFETILDFTFVPTSAVPLPATFSLFGIGLLGLSALISASRSKIGKLGHRE